MNKNKWITLVSLVITIIVMLILAGVSLNLITGENSILSKAETGYINGYRPNQGIGSGAGYLEKSNGIFANITN